MHQIGSIRVHLSTYSDRLLSRKVEFGGSTVGDRLPGLLLFLLRLRIDYDRTWPVILSAHPAY